MQEKLAGGGWLSARARMLLIWTASRFRKKETMTDITLRGDVRRFLHTRETSAGKKVGILD